MYAIVVSFATLAVWFATGMHYYTKYEVVSKSKESTSDGNDPLAGTGFYDDDIATAERVVRRPEFHLGLLPTPQGLLDRHLLSVTTVLGLTWCVTLVPLIWRRQVGLPGAGRSP